MSRGRFSDPAWFLTAFLLLSTAVGALAEPPGPPVIEEPAESPAPAPEGHLVLRWNPPQDGDADRDGTHGSMLRYELERSREPGFPDGDIRPVGVDRAAFVSGLPPGEIHFRVRALDGDGEPGPWSEPVTVAVEYPSRGRVRGLLLLGLGVFLATVALVVFGHLKTLRTSSSDPDGE
jgi:hypothetical protein